MTWRQKAAPLVRWGGVLIGLLFAVSSAWSIVGWFVRAKKSVPALVIYVYGM